MAANKKPSWLGFRGYDKVTEEYTPPNQLPSKTTRESQPGKTFWDWLQLLIIPFVLAGATLGFGWWQANLAQQQHANDQKIAQENRDADQQRALDQQRATILQTYIDNIQDLMVNYNLPKSNPTDGVAIIARARTLTALEGLDKDTERRYHLLVFLYEARLIGFAAERQVIDLSNANIGNISITGYLSGINLSNAYLSDINLSGADLSGADLSDTGLRSIDTRACLCNADLSGADLSGADLSDTVLSGANLSGANLSGANLSGANLSSVRNLFQSQLDQVFTCKGAVLPPGLTCHRKQSPP